MTNKDKAIAKDYAKYTLILKFSNLVIVAASVLFAFILHFENPIAIFIGIGMFLIMGLAITIEGQSALSFGQKRKEKPHKEVYERTTFYLYAFTASANAILLITLLTICFFV